MTIQMEETLEWILDGVSKHWDDEENAKRIEFVHSLGLKCDCVGWSKLNLHDPRCDEILRRIDEFCKENGWTARGNYYRNYIESDPRWYRLCCEDFKESELSEDDERFKSQTGEKIILPLLKAYAILGNGPKTTYFEQCVSEDFRNACLARGLNGLRYCWARDIGKYSGMQYFAIVPQERVPQIMHDASLSYEKQHIDLMKSSPIYNRIQTLGGKLPAVMKVFTTLKIHLINCYLQKDMPDAYFAYGYQEETFSSHQEYDILIRSDALQQLQESKVLTKSQVSPVFIAEQPIPGYIVQSTMEKPFPSSDVLESRLESCRSLQQANRPKRIVTQKDALRIFEYAKKQRAEECQKGPMKKHRECLRGTEDEPLMDYYAICNGGWLNDEFRLLSYEESQSDTKEFLADMQKEETKSFAVNGIVFAKCVDGDHIVLSPTKEVMQIDHEGPGILGQWSSLEAFFEDKTT